MLNTESRSGVIHPPKDIDRGLSKPQQEKKPINHHIVRKTIAGVMAGATIASYGVFHKEINNFVGDVFNGVNFFPTAEASEPTSEVDEYIIPEGLEIEDNNLRKSVKEMFYSFGNKVDKNVFELDSIEVKNYLLTGETKDYKTFEVLNDAQDKPAFVVVKGGNNGFDEKILPTIKRGISKLNKIDSNLLRIMVDKYGLRFISADIDNEETFERCPTWGGTYRDYDFGGIILLNNKLLNSYLESETSNKQDLYDDIDFIVMGTLIVESRAIYTTSKGTSSLNTFAPDRLDDNIGIDKGLYILNLSQKWFDEGRISNIDKIRLDNSGRAALSYYYDNK